MKRLRSIFGIVLAVLVNATLLMAQNGSYVETVVIDAGHGGKDPGALGRNSKEKDIALTIALKTGHYIEKNIEGVEVIYTRKTDKFIELHERADIANKNNADLFISIHCNANVSSSPRGAETYVMGLHKSEENLEIAKKENSAILLEENYREQYDGFDPNSDEGYISLSLMQNAFLDQSIKMADAVQNQFRERVGMKDRSVRQAGFLVLYHTTMPGVLIETGFISNPRDEKFLLSDKGQAYIASGIYRAFKEYKREMEKNLPPKEKKKALASNKGDGNNNNHSSSGIEPIYFSVQIETSPQSKPINNNNFKEPDRVQEYKHNGSFKYIVGKTTSVKKARELQKEMRSDGYKGAFVVAFDNQKRISVNEALKRMKDE